MNGNAWQLCPKCNGSGRSYQQLSTSSYTVCDVCNGGKIISQLTGLPPLKVQEFKPNPFYKEMEGSGNGI